MHLDRLVAVLETVAIAGRPVSATDVQQATGLPRPTCYRLLNTLAEQRLLDQPDGGNGFIIGQRLHRIALLGQPDADVCRAAAPRLKSLAIEIGEAVFLSRFRDREVEIIHVETPSDESRSFIHPGLGSRPLHACSCSKVIAAFADKHFRHQILSAPLKAYTDQTKTEPGQVEQEFAKIRNQGFAECVEEIEVGVSSVAAPIRIGDAGVPLSVGATGPIRRFTAGHRRRIGKDLIATAGQIAATLQLAQIVSVE